MKKILKRIGIFLLVLGLAGGLTVVGLNLYVTQSTKERIITAEEAAQQEADCILVLGCAVLSNGQPSRMLQDRLDRGIELYEAGAAPKLLMSGDHGQIQYDEVSAMKQTAMEAGVPSQDVFMDHAGFSTYESLYRAKEIFQAEKVVIVTQRYHLYRALYIARSLGLEAWGVAAEDVRYAGQTYRDLREALARVKDVGSCILKPEPTYLGEVIPVNGNGDLTND